MSRIIDNKCYYIYFWDSGKKQWIVNRQRFIFPNPMEKNPIFGQYITSMWLNAKIDYKEDQAFIIAGFDKEMEIHHPKKFLKCLNNCNEEEERYNIDTNNMSIHCSFIEYFQASKDVMLDIYNEAEKKGGTQYMFMGTKNKENELQLRFDYADNILLFNLPDIKLYV